MKKDVGVFKLDNGYWGFRLVVDIDGKVVNYRRTTDLQGMKLPTKTKAIKAREALLISINSQNTSQTIARRTFAQVFSEYCEKGRSGKAYATIRKQDSLWKNHIKDRFGKRFVDEVCMIFYKDNLRKDNSHQIMVILDALRTVLGQWIRRFMLHQGMKKEAVT